MRISVHIWDRDSVTDVSGRVISSRALWAKISYNPETGALRETRDARRWPNGYGDEFSYRDRDGVALAEFMARADYYAGRGYLLRFTFGSV